MVQNQHGQWGRNSNLRWNCTFAAKGESSDARNLRSLGMCIRQWSLSSKASQIECSDDLIKGKACQILTPITN